MINTIDITHQSIMSFKMKNGYYYLKIDGRIVAEGSYLNNRQVGYWYSDFGPRKVYWIR